MPSHAIEDNPEASMGKVKPASAESAGVRIGATAAPSITLESGTSGEIPIHPATVFE